MDLIIQLQGGQSIAVRDTDQAERFANWVHGNSNAPNLSFCFRKRAPKAKEVVIVHRQHVIAYEIREREAEE